jgi:ClpX C4-type zinc finger
MRPILPTATERFRAAFRLLTKRGDAAVHCSFCGCNRDQRHRIVAGPGVAICWECARLANDIAYTSIMEPAVNGKVRLTVTPVLSGDEKLNAAQWVSLPEALAHVASNHGSELATWCYVCGHSAIADHLSFDVICATDVDQTALP